MLLSANASALRKLRNANWKVSYDLQLPDLERLAERAQSVPQVGAIGAGIALDSVILQQTASQMSLGGMIQSIGFPSLKVFNDVKRTFKIDVGRELTEKLEKAFTSESRALEVINNESSSDGGEAMRSVTSLAVSTVVQELAQSLPVVGFFARLAWTFARFGIAVASLARDDYGKAERIYPRSRFDTRTDIDVLNKVLLSNVRTRADWTNTFSPPSLGVNVGSLPPYGVKRTDAGVEIFRVSGYREDTGKPIDWSSEGWLGMVPGTALLHSGVSLYDGKVSEIGSSLFPTSRSVATWIWNQVAGPEPLSALFSVHADALVGRWQTYIAELHEWIDESSDLNTDDKSKIIRKYDREDGDLIFGWGTSIAPRRNEWDNYQPTIVGEALRKRQMEACDTLLIAYVDENFGAFQDKALRDRFRQRRAQLLQHPAVCDVRLVDVIDAEYRQALEAAGAGSGRCQQGPRWFTAGEVAPFKPETQTGPSLPGGLGGIGPGPRRSASKAWPWLLGMTALAVLRPWKW